MGTAEKKKRKGGDAGTREGGGKRPQRGDRDRAAQRHRARERDSEGREETAERQTGNARKGRELSPLSLPRAGSLRKARPGVVERSRRLWELESRTGGRGADSIWEEAVPTPSAFSSPLLLEAGTWVLEQRRTRGPPPTPPPPSPPFKKPLRYPRQHRAPGAPRSARSAPSPVLSLDIMRPSSRAPVLLLLLLLRLLLRPERLSSRQAAALLSRAQTGPSPRDLSDS